MDNTRIRHKLRIKKEFELSARKTRENRLISENILFIFAVVDTYEFKHSHRVEYSELLSAALQGAYEAALTFDEDRRIKFITYAVWKIKRRIMESLDDNSNNFRVKRKDNSGKLRKLRELLIKGETDFFIIAKKLRTNVKEVVKLYMLKESMLPLDSPSFRGSHDFSTYHDVIPSENLIKSKDLSLCKDVSKAVEALDLVGIYIVKSYFGFGDYGEMSYIELGEVLGLSWQKVQKLLHSALRKLKPALIRHYNNF